MIRYLRYLFLAALAVVLVVVALANSQPVTLFLLPPDMAGFLGFEWSVSLPLFIVIFGGVIAGVFVGFVWEWLREHKHRVAARKGKRETERLEREIARQKAQNPGADDDILAIIDKGGQQAR